jgi:hypothetical protein
MRTTCTFRCKRSRWLIFNAAATLAVLLGSASITQAAILLPDQIGFNTSDLEQSLNDENSSSGAGSPSNQSPSSPSNDESEQQELLGLLYANLPSGGTSSGGSSTTSSSSGGSLGAGAVGWSLNSTIAMRDDSPLGRLAEDHGLRLPDPPGTDLLRPPRGV